MTTTNFCRMINKDNLIAINKWAKRLGADDVTIHRNGSITLECKNGYICREYKPTPKELYR